MNKICSKIIRFGNNNDFYLLTDGVTEKDQKIQVTTFLHLAGPQTQQIFNSFDFENPDNKNKIQCVKKTNSRNTVNLEKIMYIRYTFFSRNQLPS